MIRSPRTTRVDGPAIVRGLSVLTIATGVGVWGAVLFAPVPGALPPMLSLASSTGQNTTAVARWFGGDALRVRVVVVGLITSDGGRAAALLAVNSGAPKAYRPGQTLAPGVTLAGVGPNAVSIDQDGVIEQVAVPASPASVVHGFVPVSGSR